MSHEKTELPTGAEDLERKAKRCITVRADYFEAIVETAVMYDVESRRDDPAHKARLSKLDIQLRDAIDGYAKAGEELHKIKRQQGYLR